LRTEVRNGIRTGRATIVLIAIMLVLGPSMLLPVVGQNRGSHTGSPAPGGVGGIAGTVFDSFDNTALAGVLVTAFNTSNQATVGTDTTDVSGLFDIAAAENGTYNLTFALANYTSYLAVNVVAIMGNTTTLTVKIDPMPSTVSGTVRDGRSLALIPGGYVSLYGEGHVFVSNANIASGVYTFNNVVNRTISLEAHAGAYSTEEAIGLPLPIHSTLVQNFTIYRQYVSFSGTITGKDDKPIANVTVDISGDQGTFTVMTNETGQFYTMVPWGQYDVIVHKEGYYAYTTIIGIAISMPGHLNTVLEATPPQNSFLEGRVYSDATKKPLTGAMVTITDQESLKTLGTVSNDGGYWRIGIYAGFFQVKTTLSGYRDNTGFITVHQSETATYPTVYMVKLPILAWHVKGNVTAATVGAINGATVQAMDGERVAASGPTNVTGDFDLFVPAGSLVLTVQAAGYFDYRSAAFAVAANITGKNMVLVKMLPVNYILDGIVMEPDVTTILEGISVVFYDMDATHGGSKVIAAVYTGGYYAAPIYAGNFVRVVTVKDHQASVEQVSVTGNATTDIKVDGYLQERTLGTYTFVDWDNVTMTSVETVMNDVELQKWEADKTFGNGDLLLDATELVAYEAWLVQKGLTFKNTEGMFDVDGNYYNIDATSLAIVTGEMNGSVSDDRPFTVTTTVNLTASTATSNETRHSLGLNVSFDTATMDYSSKVVLPEGYEMRNNTADKVKVDGTATVTLDGPKGTGSEVVTLNVTHNAAPTADAGKDRYVKESTNLTFDASDSTDDFGIKAYAWDFGDGSAIETNETVIHMFVLPSSAIDKAWYIYKVNLTVFDTAGLSASVVVNVTVDGGEPTASFVVASTDGGTPITDTPVGVDELNGVTEHDTNSTTLFFNASSSKDNVDGADLTYLWDFGDSMPMKSGEAVNHSWAEPNTETVKDGTTVTGKNIIAYNVTLNVTDNAGFYKVKIVQVLVRDATVPRADIQSNVSGSVQVGYFVEYNGSRTTDNVWVTKYEWKINLVTKDTAGVETLTLKESKEGQAFNYSFDTEGDYRITLTAYDAAGNSNETSMDQAVTEKVLLPDLEPVDIKLSNSKPRDGDSVEIKVTIKNHGPGDAEGYTVRFSVGSKEIKSVKGLNIAANGEQVVKVNWKGQEGKRKITVEVNPENRPEGDTNNNRVSKTVTVDWSLMKLVIPIAVVVIAIVIIGILVYRSRTEAAAERERRRRRMK